MTSQMVQETWVRKGAYAYLWDKESMQYSNALKINTRPLKCNYYFLMQLHVHCTSRVLVIWAQIIL